MDEKRFIKNREFLYHLTDSRNLNLIIDSRCIYSTKEILSRSGLTESEKKVIMETRRPEYLAINVNGNMVYVRDQRPISSVALEKCLTDDWTVGDFIKHLNRRVFLWPTVKRLVVHYERYKSENPVILRFNTMDLIELNVCAEYSHINSGATRSNFHLHGRAPSRGRYTFKPASEFEYNVSKVAEVTFQNVCIIPDKFWISSNPNGPWVEKTL